MQQHVARRKVVGRTAAGRPFRAGRCLALVLVLLAALLLAASSAQAALVHPFLGSLTKPKPTVKKQPSSTFSPAVCGTYVDPATGLLYVADMEAEVLVNTKEEEFEEIPSIEILKVSGLEGTPQQRLAGKGENELEEACSVAVDDNTGEVYVADNGGAAIYAFNKEGKFEKSQSIFNPLKGAGKKAGENEGEAFSEELSIAVNQKSGDIYVGDGEAQQVYVFNEHGERLHGEKGEPVALKFPSAEHAPMAIAVNQSTGQVYVATQKVVPAWAEEELAADEESIVIDVFTAAGAYEKQIAGIRNGQFEGFGIEESEAVTALAIGPGGELYVADPYFRVVDEFTAAGEFLGAIKGTSTGGFHEPTGVAVDAAGRLYVADRTTESNARNGEELPGAVDVFAPAETGAPTIESSSASDVGATSAQLNAEIDPSGATVTYFFELCHGSPPSCTDVPAAPGATLSAAAPTEVHQQATGLLANTAYTYRVVLHYGPGGEHTVEGTPASFRTQIEGVGLTLPDGRSWEMVSSPKSHGASFEAITKEGGVIESSLNGDALTYVSTSPTDEHPEGNRNPAFNQLLARRQPAPGGGAEWASSDITAPTTRAQGVSTEGNQEYLAFSPDLSLALLEPPAYSTRPEPALAPGVTERTGYVRHNDECPGTSCYVPLVTPEDDNSGVPFAEPHKGARFDGATADLSHVILTSTVPLNSEPASSPNIYEWTAGAPASSRLRLVNILPSKEPAKGESPATYGQGSFARNAISQNGERVVWFSNGKSELFSRDVSTEETVKLNEPEAGIEAGFGDPEFQIATPDGTRVFFTDTQRLTAESSASSSGADLYEYDLTTHKLHDVSPNPSFSTNHEPAGVRGVVLGINEEGEQGSTVFYVANGVLDETANKQGEKAAPGDCTHNLRPRADEICNLYVSHYNAGTATWGTPRFIARVSEADRADWTPEDTKLSQLSSRVSPNGGYLAFMSQQPLTGYDNRDSAPAARGARDEEVFLYDDQAESLTCVSCNPTGARPHGVFDTEGAGEGLGLLVDRPEVWEQRWLAGSLPGWTTSTGPAAYYQSRYLNDEGRLFFDSADALVPAVTAPTRQETVEGQTEQVGVENVYEYEPPTVGSCAEPAGCVGLISSGSSEHESSFLDASLSGNDAFFITSSSLALTDENEGGLDVYDARVCGTEGCIAYQRSSSNPCASGEECHGAPPPAPTYSPPAVRAAPGNVSGGVLPSKVVKPPVTPPKPLTRAQKLKKALKACKKIKKKKKRHVCERTAYKRYGAKKSAKKSARKSTAAHRRPA